MTEKKRRFTVVGKAFCGAAEQRRTIRHRRQNGIGNNAMPLPGVNSLLELELLLSAFWQVRQSLRK
jgi:hypothetical protein